MNRGWIKWSAVLLAVLVSVILTRSIWLAWPGEWLYINDAPVRSDVIVVPSGQIHWRIPKAAKLFREGYAPAVFSAASGEPDGTLLLVGMRMPDTEIVTRLLERESVPSGAITVATGVTSTYTDALAFREYVRTHGVQSAILVTSHLHSRRARWTYTRVLPPRLRLTVIEAEQPDLSVDRWWQTEDGMLDVIAEYLKFGFYLTHY